MTTHQAGPGHTRCAWADEPREWPRNPDGTLKWLTAIDHRVGHDGPLALVKWGANSWRGSGYLQDACRVCGIICSLEMTVKAGLAAPICSVTCLRPYMGYLMAPLYEAEDAPDED